MLFSWDRFLIGGDGNLYGGDKFKGLNPPNGTIWGILFVSLEHFKVILSIHIVYM